MGILDTLQKILTGLGFHTDITMFFVLFGLGMSRMAAAITLNPFLGGAAVPARIKVGLAVIVTAVLFPSIAGDISGFQVTPVLFVALLVKESMIGATIGFLSQLIFYAVQMAGTLIDTQRGMNQATFFAPQLPGNVSLIGQLKFQAALVLFLVLDGHLMFLRALHSSFQQVPLAAFPHFKSGVSALAEQVIRISADMLVVALQLSAPVLLALFLMDVAFGALGKVAPQINVHSESQPVKSLVGLIVFFLAVAFVMGRLQGHFAEMIRNIYTVSRLFV